MSLLPRHATLPSNAQLAALLDSLDEVLLLLDARLRVSYCNRVASQWLGCEAGQPLDRALDRLAEAARAELRAALLTPKPPAVLSLLLTQGPAAGRRLPFTLARVSGSGWALRAPAAAPAPAAPPLAAGATSELVRLLWDSPSR